MSNRIAVSVDSGIADVRLNRPEKLNALDRAMFIALIETGAELAAIPSLRAVVLSGEGRAFCAGLDFASFLSSERQSPGNGRSNLSLLDTYQGGPTTFAQQAAYTWTELPVPVLVALHGVAFGGGLQLALGGDIRFATRDARLSVMEIKWGLIPDMTWTQALRNLVRMDIARELTFTGREVIGSEAREIGLVTHVDDKPLERALGMAREIAQKSPDAIRGGKELLNASVYGSRDEGLEREARWQRALLGKPNQLESVQSNLEKRPASFADPDLRKTPRRSEAH